MLIVHTSYQDTYHVLKCLNMGYMAQLCCGNMTIIHLVSESEMKPLDA